MSEAHEKEGETWWARRNRAGRWLVGCWKYGCLSLLVAVCVAVAIWNLDTSDGIWDSALEARLRASFDCTKCFAHSSDYEGWLEVSGPLDDEALLAAVRQVDGWDQIVVIAPSDTGEDVASNPALTSWWLRCRIANAEGNDYRILVVRDQAVVANFTFIGEETRLRTALLKRHPELHDAVPSIWLPTVAAVLLAGAALLLVQRRRRLRAGWKRGTLTSLLVMLALLVSSTIALELAGWPFGQISPLNAVDPGTMVEDAALVTEFRRALLDQPTGPLKFLPSQPQLEMLDVPPQKFAEIQARWRHVGGWDAIVLLGPMESGEKAATDPRIEGWWLRRRLAMQLMGSSDLFHFRVLAVRDGRLVASFFMHFPGWDTETITVADESAMSGTPSGSPDDEELAARLERALSRHFSGPVPRGQSYPDSGAVWVEDHLSLDDFRRRASTVDGWDQIVIVGAHDHERLVADDPALASESLRDAVRNAPSWEQDGMKELLVVRDGRVVASLTIECESADFESCVVERLR